ncbi:hypothetical protein LPJ61_004623 [Coemansia biformis]|uniref:WD40 repeat-like protein n=1 Tax=Coemansia biformis TaxID=1286918 RepID=A0A9W7Y886_9FUNG|nr:hypothetical protein LPJ61_004623 [Coemansia biformis]
MRPGQMEVISASENGEVKSWDLRHQESVYTLYALADSSMDHRLTWMAVHENAPVTMTASDATVRIWNQRGNNIGMAAAAAAPRNTNTTAAAYMKSLAGYGTARVQNACVAAAALHAYLPVALMVADDGRVSCIQASQVSSRPPTLAGSRASSVH